MENLSPYTCARDSFLTMAETKMIIVYYIIHLYQMQSIIQFDFKVKKVSFSTSCLPPSVSFIIIFFFIIRCKERDCSQIFILGPDTSQYAETMYFAINSRASALLYGNFNIPVILKRKRLKCSLLGPTYIYQIQG